jgi:hypothetical protein
LGDNLNFYIYRTFLIKFLFVFIALQYLSACKFDGEYKLPKGFEKVAVDSNAYFIALDEEFWGDRLKQREVGDKICEKKYKKDNYCEVYYFANKDDIPESFPIMNRINPIGIYENKYGKRKLRSLERLDDKKKSGKVVFFKKISEAERERRRKEIREENLEKIKNQSFWDFFR